MFQVSAAAYVKGRFQSVLVRDEGSSKVFTRLVILCAASFTDDLPEAARDQIKALTGHAFRLHAMSTLACVFPLGSKVYPSESQIAANVSIVITSHSTETRPQHIAHAVVELDLTETGSVLLASPPSVDLLDMYPADWGHLFSRVEDSGYTPYDVEEVLNFLRSIDHDQAEVWIRKVQTFRDRPHEWSYLVMRETNKIKPAKRVRSLTSLRRGLR